MVGVLNITQSALAALHDLGVIGRRATNCLHQYISSYLPHEKKNIYIYALDVLEFILTNKENDQITRILKICFEKDC